MLSNGRSPGARRPAAHLHAEPSRFVVIVARPNAGLHARCRGMVDDGEHVSATVKREFEEEAGNITDPAAQARFKSMIEELFKSGQVVYRGYVDEARNTDHAWIETSVFHMHCTEEVGRLLPLEAGDDASHVMWFDIGDGSTLPNMYPPHRGWIGQVAKSMHKV
eukprot:Transcript_4116.p2 GENE.Transcript_4116~~Transcript_4116.p2  ORF type:complete len:164 (-),score=27.43 Transcript_4116:228-719(-)